MLAEWVCERGDDVDEGMRRWRAWAVIVGRPAACDLPAPDQGVKGVVVREYVPGDDEDHDGDGDRSDEVGREPGDA
jgi:hypothetical protein